MADLVENVLREAAEKESHYKTTQVSKDIDLEIDEGHLLSCDPNPIDVKEFRSNKEAFLTTLARDNTQLLINKIWELPTEVIDDVVVAQLPEPKTALPREKPIPKKTGLTKWDQYAKLKGIQNKKKSRMTWDEPTQSYKPRWGYQRTNDNTKDWLIEIPENQDPYQDFFGKRQEAKKERVAKNELKRLRNIARSQHKKVPGVGLTPTEAPSKEYLGKAMTLAKKSTASIGKFTETLPKEKPAKFAGTKRKYAPNHGDLKAEASNQLSLLNELGNRPVVDTTRAANMEIKEYQSERAKRRREDPNFGKKKPAGKRSNQGKKNQGHKGGFHGGKKGRGGGGGGRRGGKR